jgi:nitroreductase
MELMEAIRKRRSIWRYKPDPVQEKDITHVLEAARLAPSWSNAQSYHFVVVTDEHVRRKVAEAGMGWIVEAPVIIVACSDPAKAGAKGDQLYYLVDVGIALEHLMLAATELGLGTCWVGVFDEAMVKEALGVPEDIRVVASTPLGYPDEAPHPRKIRGIEKMVSYNKYVRAL